MFFFFNDTATTEIYTLSLHDALPISRCSENRGGLMAEQRRSTLPQRPKGKSAQERSAEFDEKQAQLKAEAAERRKAAAEKDRKSTRLNSSHANISYAVFCLKKKKKHR